MAEVNVYVDTDATGSGSGVDWTNAYTSLSAAEAAEQTDLVSDGDNIIFNCRASSGTADSTEVDLYGWTTGASNDIQIIGNQSTGKYSTSEYRIEVNNTSRAFRLREDYVTLDKLQIKQSGTGTGISIEDVSAIIDIHIKKCILNIDGGGRGIGFFGASTTSGGMHVVNSLIYNPNSQGGLEGIISDLGAGTHTVFNCTIYNFNDGIERDTGTLTVTNCAVFGNADDFDGAMTIVNCASDDGDGSNPQTLDSTDNYSNEFTDITTGDFSVTDADSSLYNTGTNTGAPADDIIGTSRPQVTTTDIGAFELVAGGAPTISNHAALATISRIFDGEHL